MLKTRLSVNLQWPPESTTPEIVDARVIVLFEIAGLITNSESSGNILVKLVQKSIRDRVSPISSNITSIHRGVNVADILSRCPIHKEDGFEIGMSRGMCGIPAVDMIGTTYHIKHHVEREDYRICRAR